MALSFIQPCATGTESEVGAPQSKPGDGLMLFPLNNSTQTKKISLLVTYSDIVRYTNLTQ